MDSRNDVPYDVFAGTYIRTEIVPSLGAVRLLLNRQEPERAFGKERPCGKHCCLHESLSIIGGRTCNGSVSQLGNVPCPGVEQ